MESPRIMSREAKSANMYDSDEQLVNFLPHPNIDQTRDRELSQRSNPKYSFVEHPNIMLDRIKRYSNYTKRVSTPILIGVPKRSSCECKKSVIFENIRRKPKGHGRVLEAKQSHTSVRSSMFNMKLNDREYFDF
jgi:hypothetical protein